MLSPPKDKKHFSAIDVALPPLGLSESAEDAVSESKKKVPCRSNRQLTKWLIWLTSLFISTVPLYVIPLVKFRVIENYNDWAGDIFGNVGILMIALSCSVSVMLELGGKNYNGFRYFIKIMILGIMGCSSVVYTVAYIVFTAIEEYAKVTGMTFNLSNTPELVSLHIVFILIMFILGTLSFFIKKEQAV